MIKKYRRKPIELEAIQLTHYNILKVYEFINGPLSLSSDIEREKFEEYKDFVILKGMPLKTLESDNETQTASIGDYVIKGTKGEFYPRKPDIFPNIYDEVKDGE